MKFPIAAFVGIVIPLLLCPSVKGQISPGAASSSGTVFMHFNHVAGGIMYETPPSIGYSSSSHPSLSDDHTMFEPYGDPNELLHGAFSLQLTHFASSRAVSTVGKLRSATNSVEGTFPPFYGQFTVRSDASHQSSFVLTQATRYSVRCNAQASGLMVRASLAKDNVEVFDMRSGAAYAGMEVDPPGFKSGILPPGTYSFYVTAQCQSRLTDKSEASLDFNFQVGPPDEGEPKAHLIFYAQEIAADHLVGHAFLQLVSKSGEARYYGFFPLMGFFDSPGIIAMDAPTWNYGIDYPLSDEQYERVSAAVLHDILAPPHYNLFSFNCNDWISRIANVAGIALPPRNNSLGISDPVAFANFMRLFIGVGNIFNGGIVIGNATPGLFRLIASSITDESEGRATGLREVNGLPSVVSATAPYNFSYTLAANSGHSDPSQLANLMAVAYDPVDLGTLTANAATGLAIQLSEVDPQRALISVLWGDGSANEGQALSFTHLYQEGTYQAHLLVVDAGAVHSYPMTVTVSSGSASVVQISPSSYPSTSPLNDSLTPASATDILGFVPVRAVSMTMLPNSHPLSRFTGVPGWTFTIQAGHDLSNFVKVGAATADSEGKLEFEDPVDPSVRRRFYRATYP